MTFCVRGLIYATRTSQNIKQLQLLQEHVGIKGQTEKCFKIVTIAVL